jgi:hypothetical protein
MLRAAYLILALSLLLTISHVPANHQPVTITSPHVTLSADGGSPEPPPIPLAQPKPLLADGGSPEPPPIPLAQPRLLLADGGSPEPPPIPLAQPRFQLAAA